jgi:hypothetical protein
MVEKNLPANADEQMKALSIERVSGFAPTASGKNGGSREQTDEPDPA